MENIHRVLEDAMAPPGCDLPFEATAFDVFAVAALIAAAAAGKDLVDDACAKKAVAELTRD